MIKLLHIEKGIPQAILNEVLSIQRNLSQRNLELSRHIVCRLENCNHKHHYTGDELISCVERLKSNPVIPFEVEVAFYNGVVIIKKYVVRIKYNDTQDISVVIRGDKIITAWINDRDDAHKTLDLSKYDSLLF